jgi:hypothetical protein
LSSQAEVLVLIEKEKLTGDLPQSFACCWLILKTLYICIYSPFAILLSFNDSKLT